MIEYTVEKSFWVSNKGKPVNWDPAVHGREGVGIPVWLIQDEPIKITIRNRGLILLADPDVIRDHDSKWHTGKTAPLGTVNKFVIVPVQVLKFIGYTPEKQQKIQDKRIKEKLIESGVKFSTQEDLDKNRKVDNQPKLL